MAYKRKDDSGLFKSDEEMAKEAKTMQKSIKTNSKINKNNTEITYEIDSNDSKDNKQLPIIKGASNKLIAESIAYNDDFPVKAIIGDPARIRKTVARLIRAGLKGQISQQVVNSTIWQLKQLIYIDTVCADLTIYNKLIALEKQVKSYENKQ